LFGVLTGRIKENGEFLVELPSECGPEKKNNFLLLLRGEKVNLR
jgi:hypothetical protein